MDKLDPTAFAKHQRRTANSFELLMWQLLRNRQRCEMKFRRQHPLGRFTADFYCPEAKLVIEVDGQHHFTEEGKAYDKLRDAWMIEQGLRVLRFTGKQVELETQLVIKMIEQALSM